MTRRYECSFAGITIPLATPEHEEFLARIHPQTTFDDWSGWNFQGNDLQSLPTPSWPQEPPFKIGVLNWPTGAVRPAWFHFVCNAAKLNEIRAVVGDPMYPFPLVMKDGTGRDPITAQMYLLPPRPLNQLGLTQSDGWLVTLADTRFYWNWRRGEIKQIIIPPATEYTWNDLFDRIAELLNTTIDVDFIDDVYGVPSAKWFGYYRPTATVLDAAATQIGHRVVVNLDGTVRTVRWETARAESFAQIEGSTAISGGFLLGVDLGRYVPYAVDVLSSNGAGQPPRADRRYLGMLDLQELYGTASGVPGTAGTFITDDTFTGDNGTTLEDLADVVAVDWYGWRAPDVDVVFPGIANYVPTGWEDRIEWTYQRREDTPFASTMVRRGVWDDFVSGKPGDGHDDKGPCFGDLVYKDECVNGFLVRYVAHECGSGSGADEPDWQWDADLNVPCTTEEDLIGGSGSGGSGTPVPPPTPQYPTILNYVADICADCLEPAGVLVFSSVVLGPPCFRAESGVAAQGIYLPYVRIRPEEIIVEKQRTQVLATSFSDDFPTCEEAQSGCCDGELVSSGSGAIGGSNCCPNQDQAECVSFMISGPIGRNCVDCEIDGTICRPPPGDPLGLDPLTWSGSAVGCPDGSPPSNTTTISLSLTCIAGQWRASGKIIVSWNPNPPPLGLVTTNFDIPLTDDGDGFLVGEIVVSKCEDIGVATLVIERPCEEAPPPATCANCNDIAGSLPNTLYAHNCAAVPSHCGVPRDTIALTRVDGVTWHNLDFGSNGIDITLKCNTTTGGWNLSSTCGWGLTLAPLGCVASPFSVTFPNGIRVSTAP